MVVNYFENEIYSVIRRSCNNLNIVDLCQKSDNSSNSRSSGSQRQFRRSRWQNWRYRRNNSFVNISQKDVVDEETKSLKLKAANILKNGLLSLSDEYKRKSMKQLIEGAKHLPTSLKKTTSEKHTRRIAHKPKPVKPSQPTEIPQQLIGLVGETDFSDGIRKRRNSADDAMRQLLQDLMALSPEDLKRLARAPKSSDQVVCSRLTALYRPQMSEAMRKLAEHKLELQQGKSPQIMAELEQLLEPDMAIDMYNMPLETVQCLQELFNIQLDVQQTKSIDLNVKSEPDFDFSSPNDHFFETNEKCEIKKEDTFFCNSENPELLNYFQTRLVEENRITSSTHNLSTKTKRKKGKLPSTVTREEPRPPRRFLHNQHPKLGVPNRKTQENGKTNHEIGLRTDVINLQQSSSTEFTCPTVKKDQTTCWGNGTISENNPEHLMVNLQHLLNEMQSCASSPVASVLIPSAVNCISSLIQEFRRQFATFTQFE